MPISAISSSTAAAFYQPAFDGGAAFATVPDTDASQTSSIVTLGNAQGQGQAGSVTPMSTASLSSMSLSEAWAPQMHVQADADHDNMLSAGEFEAQMKRVGIDVAQAQEMFRNFDKSGDGRISVEEYVAGVKASNSSGSMLFNKLLDTYVRDANGKINDQAETDFLSKGSAAAEKYWGGRR